MVGKSDLQQEKALKSHSRVKHVKIKSRVRINIVCLFVCLFDTPGAFPWTFSPLATGWQTWEDHAALPTNGLARESNNIRGSFSARTNYLLERTWRTGLHREVHLRASTDAEVRRDEPLRLLHDGSTLVLEFRGCQAPQKTAMPSKKQQCEGRVGEDVCKN